MTDSYQTNNLLSRLFNLIFIRETVCNTLKTLSTNHDSALFKG